MAALVGVALLAIPGSPAHKKTRLGLDLQGGLEVVLQAIPPKGEKVTQQGLDNAVSILHPHAGKWFASGVQPVRTGVAHPTICPYETFACVDGPFFIGAGNDRQFRSLAAALGAPELANDPHFPPHTDRLAPRECPPGRSTRSARRSRCRRSCTARWWSSGRVTAASGYR